MAANKKYNDILRIVHDNVTTILLQTKQKWIYNPKTQKADHKNQTEIKTTQFVKKTKKKHRISWNSNDQRWWSKF